MRQVTFVVPAPATQVDAFGVRVEIRVGGDRGTLVVDRVPALWEFCSPGSGGPADVVVEAVLDSDPQVCAAADEAGLVSRHDIEDLLQVLTQRITVSAIDASRGRHLMLHAACLGDPATGAAVTADPDLDPHTEGIHLGGGRRDDEGHLPHSRATAATPTSGAATTRARGRQWS